jgi:tetratricopeptide (TPR) repeat protein
MMTTKKRRRFPRNFVVVAAVVTLLTACGPPGARELHQGEKDIKEGQYADAIAVLRDATRILVDAPASEQAKAWNLLGLACQDGGQLDNASKAYLQALKLDRNNAAIDYNLGCLRIQQNDFPAATNYLTTYVLLRGNDARGYLRRGTAYFHYALERTGAERTRLLNEARRDFEAAEKMNATADAINALGVLKLQSRSPGTETLHAAESNFALAWNRDPHCAPALLNLAILYQQYLNNPRQALKLYRQYLTITPPPPHVNEATRLAHDLDLSLRISITPAAPPASIPAPVPASHPTPPPAKTNAPPSNSVAAMPRPPPAQAPPVPTVVPTPEPRPAPTPAPVATAPTPEIAPPPAAVQVPLETSSNAVASNALPEPVVTDTNPEPRKTIIQRLNPLHLFSNKPKTRDEAAASGAVLAPEPPPVPPGTRYDYPPPITPIPGNRAQARRLEAQAIEARQAGDMARCIRYYKEAMAADPTFYNAFHGLGLAALEVRDYATALEALHRALALQEDSAECRYAFAWTLQRRGYIEDAVHELGKLLEQHPDDARGHLLLGSIYAEKLKQPKLAREQYMQALALDPNNAQAANVRAWLRSN